MSSYEQLVAETKALCASIADYPEKRLAVRQAFYQQYGFPDKYGLNYGDSEIAFLQWEIKRGVLNAMDDPTQAGSPWWRDVNLNFIFYSELAGKMKAANVVNPEAPVPVQKWLTYISNPRSTTWYRAHNTSILAGFQLYIDDAKQENSIEQEFLNITLYRLLFAQALVEDATIFGDIGALAADPELFAVKFITSLPDFYPPHYPLTAADQPVIEGKEHTFQDRLVYVMDQEIILPHIFKLYTEVSCWDDSSFVMSYLNNKVPCYPFLSG